MKKRLLSGLLMCCMVLTMLPTTAFAATQNYNLWIGGERVTSDNLSGDGWKFEPETNTLVLNGFGLATWGYNMGTDFLGRYPKNVNMFAIIYAEGKMDLTIRTEGKPSYIGDPDFANRAYEKSKRAYTAIYNSGGKVTITGNAKLTVGANYRGIFCDNSGELIFDNAREVEVVTFGGDTLHASDITVKGNSCVNTTVGHAGAGVPTMNIYATYTVKVYAGSSLKSDFELGADTSGSNYAGIKCISGKKGGGVYACGGEIRSQVYPAGYDIGNKTLYAIDAPVVNIEGDGVVDGNIYNWYNPNEYYVNSVVYGFSDGKGKVKFNGPGILRLQMSTAKPDGSSKIQQLRPDSISFAENLLYQTDTSGSCREEITAYTCDGIFLSSKGVYQYWSYSEKNLYPAHYGEYYGSLDLKSDALNLKDVVTKTLSVSKLVVMENSTNMVNPNVDEGFEIPEMTVKSGATLTLKFDKDRDYTFTKPIYLEGGTLEINGAYGSGVITGLDVRGNGTVIFGRGTVSGNVEKTVKTVMYNQYGAGGNIDIPDHGNAVDQDGNTVHKFAYKAETDYDYFDRVCIIRKVEERDFLIIDGKFLKAENGDKMLYLWTDRADRPHRIDAYPSTDSYENGQPLSLKYGTNTFAPGTPFTLKENGVFVAKAGGNVVLSPLAGGNPTDLQKSFISWVKWYVSKDGGKNFELVQATQGPTAGNSYSPDTIRFEYVIPEITAAQNGYIYRCEVCYCDVIEWDRHSYYYDATLYVDMMQLKEPDRYIDSQPARLEMTHGTTLDGVTFGYRWELSRNNGKNWETVQDGTSAVYETAAVTDAMEGWQIRVVYSIYANDKKLSEGTTDPVTIDTIGRLPVITKQPENVFLRQTEKFEDPFPPDPNKIPIIISGPYYAFSLEAKGEDLHYQWQRSKDNGRTFEDLRDEDEAQMKSWYLVEPGTAWQYRCIVYNNFGSVISNIAIPRVLYAPTVSNPQDLTVPEHTDAVFRVDITQGLPYGTDVIWQVSKDGKTMADVTAEDGTVNVYSEVVNGEIHWYTTLTVSNVSQDMSGYMYRCIVKNQPNDEDYNGLRRSRHATLTVTYSCAADGHKFDEGTVTTEANCTDAGCKVFTCSACGYIDVRVLAPLGHDWKAATCQSVKTCQREGCGVSEGGFDYTNHTGEPVWSYDDGGHTSRWNCCNTPDQPYSPHVYDDDADTTCNICGYVRTVTPPAHEHRYGDWSHDETDHWHECSDEGCTNRAESIKDKAAHDYDNEQDTTCSVCGYERTVTPPAHEHSYGDWEKDSDGHWQTCTQSGCNAQTEKVGHSYDDDTDTTCNVCGYERTVTPPAHEHSYGDWSKDGTNHWHECTDAACPNRNESITDKAAHDYDDDADTTCSVCGYERTVTPETVPVSQITLNKAETSISVGNSETLSATVAPENATIKALTWASSDENVATVAPDGTVTAVKAGAATITATAADGSGKSAVCKVTVTGDTTPPAHEHSYGDWSKDGTSHWHECTDAACPNQSESIKDKEAHVYTDDADTTCNICGYVRTVTPEIVPVSQITLNKAEASISVGNSETLTATVAPENATIKALTWASSDEDVATVAPDGTVTAVKVGTATITATAADGSDKSATCTVTVTGDTTPPAHEHRYGDWSKDATSHWHECTDDDCPNRNESITDKAAHIYDDDADTTCNVCGYVRTVTPEIVPVSQITLNKAEASISVGNSETLTATVAPENATIKALTWASSDENVATVAPDGTVTAVKVGTVTITATAADGSGKSATCTVTVIGGTTPSQPGGSTGDSSGGSSSDRDSHDSNPVIKTETKNNTDGSTTKTETRRDGSVTQTTTGKDGSVTKTETKKDGSSVTENKAADGSTGTVKTDKNGQTEAAAKVSGKAVEDAKKNGEAVKVPVEVEATRNSSTAPTVSIELPKGAGETKVEIPVSNVTPGTVAVLVHPDGTEELLKDSIPTEDGIQLTVDGSATVKIVDNSKDFIDTQDHWAKDEIDFVSARGLVNGMSATIYAPNNSTTRAQLWTILARQVDADLTGGNTWYEKAQNWAKDKGVSDGANPNATIDRAQMVTMLWRAMGQPTAGGAANFTDVPADAYYASAVSWAVENGITTGIGNGKFDPNATCTRAQIAAFLARSMK
ncbi:Ig-like domain-containing protein [Intestinimonas butyriciproducens]|uniref:SLH domain-containing protein n=1 Tax=Intestinimonas butyriciproducens TaxID=1297617 RepID=A0A0S2W777_9FIRM|nr:Ig-like domain-containing protein [Intestinimonas butyriciproducens]ALP95177.1 hypothetical protein IB211_02786c [Intestinimonas butyriciproducens]